jgi:acyl transferase domain-containing protein
VTATSHAELTAALGADRVPTPIGPAAGTPVVTALVASGRCTASPELTGALRQQHPHFDTLYARCEQAAADSGDVGAHVAGFAFQYAYHGLLRHLGLDIRHVVGEGAGKQVLAAAAGRIDLGEALRRAGREVAAEPADLDARVDRLLGGLAGDGQLVFVELGPLSTVSGILAGRGGADHRVVAIEDGADGFPALLRDLYRTGTTWNWDRTAGDGRRVELPSYQFQRIRCWLDGRTTPTSTQPSGATVAAPPTSDATGAADATGAMGAADATGAMGAADAAGAAGEPAAPVATLDGVCEVWQQVLGMETLDAEASFFDLGGDSISSGYVISRLQTIFGVPLDVFAIFDYDTPRSLARHIDEAMAAQSRNADGTAPS